MTRGLIGLNLDAVAQRAGVSTHAVRRWWPSEEALAVDALRYEYAALASEIRRRALRAGREADGRDTAGHA